MADNEKYPMTPAGKAAMNAELKKLKEVDRPRNAHAIEVARGHGDISENADYDAAKDEQAMIEARIRDLGTKLALSEVIDPATLKGDRVMFGATVTFEFAETGESKTYTIVGDHEADLKKNRISISSPLARALIGKNVGDEARVQAPGGVREVEITEVAFYPVD